MHRADYIVGGLLALVIVAYTVLWGALLHEKAYYRWTTPPDEMCNVWSH